MANAPLENEKDWSRTESPAKAVLQIAVWGAVLFGGLYVYRQKQVTKKQVFEADKAALELMVKDNPKDLKAAAAKFEESLALDSSDPFATSSLALVHTLMAADHQVPGELATAEQWVQKSEARNAAIDERFSAQALLLVAQGKAADADTTTRAVIEKGAVGAGLANATARARRNLGKLEEARGYFKKAHDLGWRSPRFADDLADSYFDDGDAINAQGFFEKGLAGNGDHLRSAIGLARARIARGQDLVKASESLDAALAKPADELTPTLKAMALTGKAELRRFEEKYDEALTLAGEAVAADGHFASAHAVQGSVLARQGKAEAKAAFEKALGLDRYAGALYYEAARSMVRVKDQPAAEAFMAQYSSTLKVDDRYHVVYGDLLREFGNLDKAEAEYGEALKVNGLNASAHYSLGLVLAAKQQGEKAITEFDAALGAQKIFADAHIQAGNVQFDAKKFEEGLQRYAQALVMLKQSAAPREKIDALLTDVEQKLIKATKKELAKAWIEQGKELVR